LSIRENAGDGYVLDFRGLAVVMKNEIKICHVCLNASASVSAGDYVNIANIKCDINDEQCPK
jgi:hypothetical protein